MKTFVAFSGGKDSTALALLECDATPIFTDTVFEFQEVYQHLNRFEQVTGRKVVRLVNEKYQGGLPQYIRERHFLPNHGARYCTRTFKIEVLNAYLKSQLPCELLIGLRADEPLRVGNLTDMDGLTIRYPLREHGYTQVDVIRICLEQNLLPRYPVYMARGGCIGCFYKRKSEVRAMIELMPETVDMLQELEESVQDERGKFFHMFPNAGMSIAELRSQPALFDQSETYRDALDDSDKGVACGLFCHR